MGTDQQIGNTPIRSIYYDLTLKGIAERLFKFRQAVDVQTTSAWSNVFTIEDNSVLTANGVRNIKGVARGATFPQVIQKYDRVSKDIIKFAAEQNIHWEDILADDVAVQDRALYKIAEALTKSNDDYIWDQLTENRSVVNINNVNVSLPGLTAGGGGGWNESSAGIIDDLEEGEQLIAENNYPTTELLVFINPRNKRDIMRYLTDKGAQFPSIAESKLNNGVIATLGNKKFVVSNSVTTSYAMMCVPKRCATYRELVPLQTTTVEDPYRSVTVKGVAEGVCYVTDPKSIVLFTGTIRTV